MIETFSMVASMTNDRPLGASDAAAWLGDPGDLGGGLGRPLGEELVELLDGDAGGLAEHADGGAGSLGLVFGAHEPDDLPVPRREFVDALGLGDLWRHVLGPLAGFEKKNPWPNSHPIDIRVAICSLYSTPSATTSMPSVWAMSRMDFTISELQSPPDSCKVNDRSIFNVSKGSCAR